MTRIHRHASGRYQNEVLPGLEFQVVTAKKNIERWLGSALSNRQFTLRLWEAVRKKNQRTKMALGMNVDHIGTSKKIYYGSALNLTGSRPYWLEPRTAKIIPLELLTSPPRVLLQKASNWVRIVPNTGAIKDYHLDF